MLNINRLTWTQAATTAKQLQQMPEMALWVLFVLTTKNGSVFQGGNARTLLSVTYQVGPRTWKQSDVVLADAKVYDLMNSLVANGWLRRVFSPIDPSSRNCNYFLTHEAMYVLRRAGIMRDQWDERRLTLEAQGVEE